MKATEAVAIAEVAAAGATSVADSAAEIEVVVAVVAAGDATTTDAYRGL